MGRPLMSHIYPLGTEGWDGQVGQHHAISHMSLRIEGWDGQVGQHHAISHMSLRIEGWDGHRVMLKDGTSLDVLLITYGLINGMDGWDSSKSLCHWKRDVPLFQRTVHGNAGHEYHSNTGNHASVHGAHKSQYTTSWLGSPHK